VPEQMSGLARTAAKYGPTGHYANTIMLYGVLVALGLAAVCLWLGSRVFVRENA
jgi:hypothetical protein